KIWRQMVELEPGEAELLMLDIAERRLTWAQVIDRLTTRGLWSAQQIAAHQPTLEVALQRALERVRSIRKQIGIANGDGYESASILDANGNPTLEAVLEHEARTGRPHGSPTGHWKKTLDIIRALRRWRAELQALRAQLAPELMRSARGRAELAAIDRAI